jgi:hypothetical protein
MLDLSFLFPLYQKYMQRKNNIRSALHYFAAVLGAFLVTCGHEAATGEGIICNETYALCTSAPCIPDPANPEKALCQCDVEEGISFGKKSCSQRRARTDGHGIKHLVSTYSFVQYPSKKTMWCEDGNPWTYCLDMPCVVDPTDPKKAICSCDIKRSGKFLTLGGECDTATCKTAYWSGAPGADTQAAMGVLTKALGMTSFPENLCPDSK